MRIGATTAIRLVTLPVIADLETQEEGADQERVVVMTERQDQGVQDAETRDLVLDPTTAVKKSALKIVRTVTTNDAVADG